MGADVFGKASCLGFWWHRVFRTSQIWACSVKPWLQPHRSNIQVLDHSPSLSTAITAGLNRLLYGLHSVIIRGKQMALRFLIIEHRLKISPGRNIRRSGVVLWM